MERSQRRSVKYSTPASIAVDERHIDELPPSHACQPARHHGSADARRVIHGRGLPRSSAGTGVGGRLAVARSASSSSVSASGAGLSGRGRSRPACGGRRAGPAAGAAAAARIAGVASSPNSGKSSRGASAGRRAAGRAPRLWLRAPRGGSAPRAQARRSCSGRLGSARGTGCAPRPGAGRRVNQREVVAAVLASVAAVEPEVAALGALHLAGLFGRGADRRRGVPALRPARAVDERAAGYRRAAGPPSGSSGSAPGTRSSVRSASLAAGRPPAGSRARAERDLARTSARGSGIGCDADGAPAAGVRQGEVRSAA